MPDCSACRRPPASALIRVRGLFLCLGFLIGTSIAVTAAYLWLDRSIALLVHEVIGRKPYSILMPVIHIPDPLIVIADTVFVIIGSLALFGRMLSKHETAAFLASISVIFAVTIKDLLKFVFGRTWPETWVQNNPSFIRDGVYGFNFMHGGVAYQSFPSGHMTAACAIIAVLWIWYPRLRWAYAVAALIVGAGLVGGNFHFLSDVIAGAFVGISSGSIATATWNATRIPLGDNNHQRN